MKKLPYDSGLVNQPLQVILYWNDPSQVITGAGAAAYLAANPSFQEGYFQVRQGRFTNMVDSLKDEMIRNPGLIYSYPFVYQQSFQSDVTASDAVSRMTVNLTGFRSGEVVSIVVGVVDKTNNIDAATGKNPLYFREITSVRLVYNGQIFFLSDDAKSWRLQTLQQQMAASYFNSDIVNAGSTAITSNARVFLLEMPFSQFFAQDSDGCMAQRGLEIGSNTIQLEFTIEGQAASNVYRVHAMYNYNGVVKTQAGNADFLI
jgi:hypothetical protein